MPETCFLLKYLRSFFLTLILILSAPFSIALANETPEEGQQVGRKAANKYFEAREAQAPTAPPATRGPAQADSDRYMAIHAGGFVDDRVYKWGSSRNEEGIGQYNAGVSYRIGEWTRSMDLLFRADFIGYDLREGNPFKMSLMPLIVFPDARSGFPIYFGGGAGLGIFFKQISSEGSVAIDYSLVAGVRLLNVLDTVGFFAEGGIKNHFHLLSDGQFNGTFLSVGTVFTF